MPICFELSVTGVTFNLNYNDLDTIKRASDVSLSFHSFLEVMVDSK